MKNTNKQIKINQGVEESKTGQSNVPKLPPIKRPTRKAPLLPAVQENIDKEEAIEIKEINKVLASKHSLFNRSGKK